MEEQLIGYTIELPGAITQCGAIVVADVLEIGSVDPGAPGQAYWSGTKIRITLPLKGKIVGTILIAYTVQSIPKDAAEIAPKKGDPFIFFLDMKNERTIRAIKTLRPTPENLKKVSAALGIALPKPA